jgi:hypothetical protein
VIAGRAFTYAGVNLGPQMERHAVRGQNYRLVIRGELDERFAYLFEGMRMERTAGQTILTGSVRDQAQLHGFFERVEELGLDLISVQQAPDTT